MTLVIKNRRINRNYSNLKLEQFRRPEIGEEITVITINMGVVKVRLLEENTPIYVENPSLFAMNCSSSVEQTDIDMMENLSEALAMPKM